MICYEKQTTSKAPVQYNLRSCYVGDRNYLRHFDNQINTGMNTVRFLRIFFAYMSSGGLRGRMFQTTRSPRAGQVARITYITAITYSEC